MPKVEDAVQMVAVALVFTGLILYWMAGSLERLADKFAPKEVKAPEPKKPLSKEQQEQYDKEQAFFKRHGSWFVDREGSGSVADRILAVAIVLFLVLVLIAVLYSVGLWPWFVHNKK